MMPGSSLNTAQLFHTRKLGQEPENLPKRHYFNFDSDRQLEILMASAAAENRNPVVQTSFSALSDTGESCRRLGYFKSVMGFRPAQKQTGADGETMHKGMEVWTLTGREVPDLHPSMALAIQNNMIPFGSVPEVLVWHPTGLQTPHGQLWLKGKVDLMRPPENITELPFIGDAKTKENAAKALKYSKCDHTFHRGVNCKRDQLFEDAQTGLYLHVLLSYFPTFGSGLVRHVNLSRDRMQPHAHKTDVVVPRAQAQKNYLKVLKWGQQLIDDSQCNDWRAVEGNYSRCGRLFGGVCEFVTLCHPPHIAAGIRLDHEMNPYANQATRVSPPDAPPPWLVPQDEEAPASAKAQKDTQMTTTQLGQALDVNQLLNQVMQQSQPPAQQGQPAQPQWQPGQPPPQQAAPAQQSPPAQQQWAPPQGQAPQSPPAQQQWAPPQGQPQTAQQAPQPSQQAAWAPPQGQPQQQWAPQGQAQPQGQTQAPWAPPTGQAQHPPAAQAQQQWPAQGQAQPSQPPQPAQQPQQQLPGVAAAPSSTPRPKPIALLCVNAVVVGGEPALQMTSMIVDLEAAIVSHYNQANPDRKVQNSYQMEFTARAGMIAAAVPRMLPKEGSVVMAVPETPIAKQVVEALAPYAKLIVYGTK